MGQKISSQKILPDAKIFMRKYYPEYPYVELLNDGIMYKTVLITNDKDQSPLLLKIFYKDGYDENDKKLFEEELEKIKILQNKFLSEKSLLNVVPIINIRNTLRAGIIYRQYIGISLKERINLMPYLTSIEKIWITFQLLYTFNELNKIKIYHGDLKPENILLTSNLSVYIADFATYKPCKIYLNDLGSYTYYFGSYNIDSLKGCYLAPERFCINKEFEKEGVNSSMEVFSLGLIIAELFLEKNIFDFSSLLSYKKGEFTEENLLDILKGIKHDKIRYLISRMIKLDVKERITIEEAFKFFLVDICPFSMNNFLFHLNIIINKTAFWKPDLLIGFIYRYWDAIWKIIYGTNDTAPPLLQRLNFIIINTLIADNPISSNFLLFKKNKKGKYEIGNFELCFNPLNGELNLENKNKKIFEEKNNQDCVLIIINLLLQNMQNTKYESSNYIAMEMLKNFSKKLPDIMKLQLIIPYLVNNIRRTCYTTKLTSLKYIFDILYSINFDKLILPITEYNYFDSYIFPQILSFYKPEKPYLVLEFLNSLDKIIDLELKFLNITLKSRLKRLNEFVEKDKEKIIKIEDNENKDKLAKDVEMKKMKRLKEIYLDYDTNLETFKDKLNEVLIDIMGNISEIDLLITIIRKIPSLLHFYGSSKFSDLSKFIINNLNKNEWILQKEILQIIPEMMNTSGKNVLNDYILLCMEMLIENNSNEFKTYRLIETVNKLLKMEILSKKGGVDFLMKLLPFSIHPNYLIRCEMMDLIKNIFNNLTKEEIYLFFYKSFFPYLKINIPYLNNEIINDSFIININRAYYLLKLNDIEFSFPEEIKEISEKYQLISNIIINERNGDLTLPNNGEIEYNFYTKKPKPLNNFSLLDPINKYIQKETELYNMQEGEIEKKIFGKIFWLSSEKERYKIPYIQNQDIFRTNNEEPLPKELFKIKYILKTLNITIKLVKLNFLLDFGKNIQTSTNNINSRDPNTTLGNFYYNKNFAFWRPQGRLMTTTYEYESPIEKLIPMKGKEFCAFDWDCNPTIWKIKGSDDDFILKKKWSLNSSKDIDSDCYNKKFFLNYRNTVNYWDNLYFIFASGKSLYSINFLNYPSNIDIICNSLDDSFITCSHTIGESTLESQKILFTTEKGSINLFDPRNKNISLNNNMNNAYGIPYCISNYNDDYNFFLIGTLGGRILLYDLRLNSIISEMVYKKGDPILGMFLHRTNYDRSLGIWTGNEDYEIALWNFDDTYHIQNKCNLLLKVNSLDIDDKDTYDPLLIKIPSINSSKNNTNKNNVKDNLQKYYYDNNPKFNQSLIRIKTKKYINPNINIQSFKKNVNNLYSIYDNPLTVQSVLSPLCGDFYYQNAPYLLAAGNDRTIRYWDISKDAEKKEYKGTNSYIINTPTVMTDCKYLKNNINGTTVIESNEIFNQKKIKENITGFSEYQNYNGVNYYSSSKDPKNGCSTKNLDVSHKSVITDLLCMNLNKEKNEKIYNVLISSSWDGTIKIWK